MIGADEFTAHDKNFNVSFCGSQAGVARYLEQCRRLGFSVSGTTVDATKRELEAAFARNGGAA